jgi:hypothetical protein
MTRVTIELEFEDGLSFEELDRRVPEYLVELIEDGTLNFSIEDDA